VLLSALTNALLLGWIGGLIGIAALNALDDEYHRPAAVNAVVEDEHAAVIVVTTL
jgi:hypothetical protein